MVVLETSGQRTAARSCAHVVCRDAQKEALVPVSVCEGMYVYVYVYVYAYAYVYMYSVCMFVCSDATEEALVPVPS
jgi:hypothetical protein